MATTLLDPKVMVIPYDLLEPKDSREAIEKAMDSIRGEAVSETMKVTWLPHDATTILCIVEWCVWAQREEEE